MKRVCMVVPNRMVKGGIAAVVNGYRGSQLEKDYEITYVESYKDGSKFDKLLKGICGYFHFAYVLMFHKPDLVHIHSSFGPSFYRKMPFIYMASWRKIPIINHIHGADFDEFYVNAPEGKKAKHPLNTSEPKPNKKAPACPKWLEPEAKKEWRRLAKQMEAIGILTEVDMAAFAGYCQAYARWKEAEEFITQHGTIVKTPSGYWQQVPQVSIAQTYLKIMNKFAEQFGLTPSSRSRIIASDGGPADTADEMENLLGGGGS